MPAVTYFQSATSNFLASATIVVFLWRPPLCRTRSSNQGLTPIAADGAAIARRARLAWPAVLDCLLSTRPVRDRRSRSARVWAPSRHRRRPGAGCRTVGRALPTRGRREPRADALRRATCPGAVTCCAASGVPFRLDRVDLVGQQLQSIEFTANLRLQVIGGRGPSPVWRYPAARAGLGAAARSR